VLRQVAETHHATPSQIALAWLIRRPNVVVIPGASSAAQVEVNAAAADIELTDDEDAALVAASDAFEPLGATSVLPDLIRERFSGFLGRMTGGSGPASS
jgi:diketogulonate reductase-like aldo/keto reductase